MKKLTIAVAALFLFFGTAFVIIQNDNWLKNPSQGKISEKSLIVKKSKLKEINLVNSIKIDWATIPSLQEGYNQSKGSVIGLKKHIAFLNDIEKDKAHITRGHELQNALIECRDYASKIDNLGQKIKSTLEIEKESELEATTSCEKNSDMYTQTKANYELMLKYNKILKEKINIH